MVLVLTIYEELPPGTPSLDAIRQERHSASGKV